MLIHFLRPMCEMALYLYLLGMRLGAYSHFVLFAQYLSLFTKYSENLYNLLSAKFETLAQLFRFNFCMTIEFLNLSYFAYFFA